MATKAEEKKAFKKLKEVDIPGYSHTARALQVEYRTYGEYSPEYGAYISGFVDKGLSSFYGWTYANSPMEAVDKCITKAKEATNAINKTT